MRVFYLFCISNNKANNLLVKHIFKNKYDILYMYNKCYTSDIIYNLRVFLILSLTMKLLKTLKIYAKRVIIILII